MDNVKYSKHRHRVDQKLTKNFQFTFLMGLCTIMFDATLQH